MSKHLTAIERDLKSTPVRAAGEAMGYAVVVTDDELITGKAKMFGAQIQRYPLQKIAHLRTIPNPTANVLEVHFATTPPSSLVVMYNGTAQAAFESIIALLRPYAGASA